MGGGRREGQREGGGGGRQGGGGRKEGGEGGKSGEKMMGGRGVMVREWREKERYYLQCIHTIM